VRKTLVYILYNQINKCPPLRRGRLNKGEAVKNHYDYKGHYIDVVSVITGKNNAVTVYKVDHEFACLSFSEAKECIEELS